MKEFLKEVWKPLLGLCISLIVLGFIMFLFMENVLGAFAESVKREERPVDRMSLVVERMERIENRIGKLERKLEWLECEVFTKDDAYRLIKGRERKITDLTEKERLKYVQTAE